MNSALIISAISLFYFSIFTNSTIQNFVANSQSSTWKDVCEIDEYFGDGDYVNGAAEVYGMAQNDLCEQNAKRIYEIFLSTLAIQNDSVIAANDSTDLSDIAFQCPLSGGKSVYMARSLRNHLYRDNIVYIDNCEEAGRQSQFSNAETNSEFSHRIVPNPSNGLFRILHDKITSEDAYYVISSIDGRELLRGNLDKNESETEVQTHSITNGIYLISIYFSGQLRSNDKIIITK